MDLHYFLEKIDVFGRPIQLTINGSNKHKTVLGGVFSVCAYLIIAVLLFSKLLEFLKRTNANVNYESFRKSVPAEMNYTFHDLSINIILLNTTDYTPIKDFSSIFSIDFNFYQMHRFNQTTRETEHKIVKKKCSDFKDVYTQENNFSNFYQNNYLEMGACMGNTYVDQKTNEEKHIVLKGAFITEYFSQITLYLKKCNSSQLNNNKNNTNYNNSGFDYNGKKIKTCKSDQEIKNIVENSFLEFYYIDKNIDYSNYDDPINKYFANQFWKLEYGSTWHGILSFKNIEIKTDQGFFMQDFWQTDFFSFDSNTNFIEKDLENNTFAKIDIIPSFLGERYQRTYIKIQDISTSIGGTFKLLLIVGNLITFFPYTYSLYESALQSLFSYTYEDTGNERIDLMIMKRMNERNEINSKNKMMNSSSSGSLDARFQHFKNKNNYNNHENNFHNDFLNKDEDKLNSSTKRRKKHKRDFVPAGAANAAISHTPSKDSIIAQLNNNNDLDFNSNVNNNDFNDFDRELKAKDEEVIFDDNKTIFKRNVSNSNIKCPNDSSRTILMKNAINKSKVSENPLENSSISKSQINLLKSLSTKINSNKSLGLISKNNNFSKNNHNNNHHNTLFINQDAIVNQPNFKLNENSNLNKDNQIELHKFNENNKSDFSSGKQNKENLKNENNSEDKSSFRENDVLIQKLQKFEDIVNKVKNFENEFIKFSLFDMINIEINFFCKNFKMTNNARKKAEKLNKIKNYWDFLMIIRILRDSMMMKNILFSERQINLFKFFDSNYTDSGNINHINDDHILECLLPKHDNHHVEDPNQKIHKFINKNFHAMFNDIDN